MIYIADILAYAFCQVNTGCEFVLWSIVLIGAAGSAEALFNIPIILIILGGYAYNEKRYA